jgi:hypothetical protein
MVDEQANEWAPDPSTIVVLTRATMQWPVDEEREDAARAICEQDPGLVGCEVSS